MLNFKNINMLKMNTRTFGNNLAFGTLLKLYFEFELDILTCLKSY